MKFKDLFEKEITINEESVISSNTITAKFKNNVNDKKVKDLLNSFDTQTWAIESLDQKKKAESNNKEIINRLKKLGKGSISFKSGRFGTTKTIEF